MLQQMGDHGDNSGRSHFATLDGFRGLAALAVVAHHLLADLGSSLSATSAYLAVDFFFVLSGLVIARAYERKLLLEVLSFTKFVRIRLVRLYPLIGLGAVIGIAWRFVEGRFNFQSIVASGIFSLILLPIPRFGNVSANSFPINGPAWSLTYEIFVNIIYAALVRHISNNLFIISIIVTSILDIAMAYANHGLLASTSWEGQPAAFIRALAPFLIGVMLYRRLATSVSDSTLLSIASSVALFALLCVPYIGFYYDIPCALVIFPMLVIIGRHDPASLGLRRFWKRLGALSYPIYALNYPVIFFLHRALAALALLGRTGMLVAFVAGMGVIVLIGQAMLLLYDIPVRRWLTRAAGDA